MVGDVFLVVLGEMQDGGLPHIGCRCPRCASGRVGYAACAAIVDRRGAQPVVTLLDATPDIKHQLAFLAEWLGPHGRRPFRFNPPHAICLTHAHLGHVGGLPMLGPEAMAVSGLPVYASSALVALLQETGLWGPAVAEFDLRPFTPYQPTPLGPDLALTAIPVPHRDELDVGTFAFRLDGPGRTLLYLPDIDDWHVWTAARTVLAPVDVALVDGCFWSVDELNGRPPVTHPLIPDTLAFFAGWPGELVLTHLNHTNPVLESGSAAETAVVQAGAQLAHFGQTIPLD